MISEVLLIGHWLIVVGLSLRVIVRRLPVGVSVAWLAVIFSVPVVGAVLYLLFGEKRLGRRRAARIAANLDEVQTWQAGFRRTDESAAASINPWAEPLDRLAGQVLGFPAQAGNELRLLDSSDRFFDALVADIDTATERCHLAFYIWFEGGRTADVVDALIRAAERGVECRALGDALGSQDFLRSDLLARLRRGGVGFSSALPTSLLSFLSSRADLRNHRKIVVIDDRVAYTGSQNLVDPRFFKQDSGVGEWVDAMVRVTGPAARALGGVFALDWSVETGSRFVPPERTAAAAPGTGGSVVQVVPSGPDLRPEAIHQLLLTAIYGARRELVMTTPYFVPDESILTALLSAALRGVAVTLVVPAHNDSRLVRYASVAHFDDLMSAGVRIALFGGGLLHTKSLTVDGEVSIFGSVNLDMRSLWLNFEISLFVYDPGFTNRLRELQAGYLDRSTTLDLATWRERPRWHQLAEDAVRLLSPLL
ncbi:MAG: cardiolipin synthase [Acidobacteria bacterium]|nr:cardiolipin synthase [Acidobacteriota bacterium]